MVMLFMAVSSLFETFAHDRTTAGLGATGIFKRAEIYQLILAPIAILSTFLSVRRGLAKTLAVVLLVLATMAAGVIAIGISPRIDEMRIAGTTNTETFRRLHGAAMATYLLVTSLVAAALVSVTVSWRAETSATTSPGRGFPAEPAR
jgi:hypothetical protein